MKLLKSMAIAGLFSFSLYTSSQSLPSGMEYGKLNNLTSSTIFSEAIASGNVVVKFYATWCQPCTDLTTVMRQLCTEFTDVLFVEVNVDSFEALSKQYQVRSIPTVFMFKNGTQVSRTTGFKDKSYWVNAIKSNLGL